MNSMTLDDITNSILNIIKDNRNAIFFLKGHLGAGKTFLVRKIAKKLGIKNNITSPTFVILKRYKWGESQLIHIDLYRMLEEGIDIEEVLAQIGFWDYVDNSLMFIEWGDAIIDDLKNLGIDAYLVTINKLDETDEREYKIRKL